VDSQDSVGDITQNSKNVGIECWEQISDTFLNFQWMVMETFSKIPGLVTSTCYKIILFYCKICNLGKHMLGRHVSENLH
jgi:hypothetical protein